LSGNRIGWAGQSHLPRYSGERRIKSSGSGPLCGLRNMPKTASIVTQLSVIAIEVCGVAPAAQGGRQPGLLLDGLDGGWG